MSNTSDPSHPIHQALGLLAEHGIDIDRLGVQLTQDPVLLAKIVEICQDHLWPALPGTVRNRPISDVVARSHRTYRTLRLHGIYTLGELWDKLDSKLLRNLDYGDGRDRHELRLLLESMMRAEAEPTPCV